MAFIYHERQLGALCGVHCLNNLLQGPQFGPGDLAEIGKALDHQERLLLGGADGQTSGAQQQGAAAEANSLGYNVDSSAEGGNFSIQVLSVALQRFNLHLLPARHPEARGLMADPGTATVAYLCQYRDHWFAIRLVADCWWNLNSTRKSPAQVGHFYLAAWLSQLGAEGYSIFLVMGNSWPAPSKPRDPQRPDEMYHDVFELLEKAKTTGGNPLAGGDGDDMDADRRAALALQEEEDMRQACPVEDNRPFAPFGLHGGSGQPFGHERYGPAHSGSLPTSTGASAGTDLPHSLRDMGFAEPLIRAAERVASRSGSPGALQLMLNARSVTADAQVDDVGFARTVQQAVLSCDTRTATAFDQKLLDLVALLCLDGGARLRAARPHLNGASLGQFLQSVVHGRSGLWPRHCAEAADVAVDLLSREGGASPPWRGEPSIASVGPRTLLSDDDGADHTISLDCRNSSCATL